MPGIELSSLTAQELRLLLATARGRTQSTLADAVTAELASRGRRDAAIWTGLPVAAEPEVEEAPRRGLPKAVAALLVGAVLAAGAGWWLTRPPPPAEAPAAIKPPAPQPQPITATVVVPPPPAVIETVRTEPPEAAAPRRPQRVARRTPAPVRRATAAPRPATVATSAPERRIRQAYERALAAGADPLDIDRGQADFRQALEGTRNPVRRAAIYEERLHQLEAAASR